MNKKIDMTTGPIMSRVLLFALPMIFGNILQQLYTTVDTWIIGNYCEKAALGAMGTSSQPVEVLLCVFLGIGGGVSILVSQYTGAGEKEKLKRVCETAIFFIFVCGIPLAFIGFFVAPYIMTLMGVPEDAYAAAVSYTRIVFLGTLGNLGYNMNAGILRGMGDSKASLKFLAVSCVVNVALDILFVAVWGMGVSGAALATIIAMYMSWLVSINYIRRRMAELEFTYLPHTFSSEELKNILNMGLPIGLSNSLFAFGHMVLQVMVNANGSVFMSGATVAGRVTNLTNVAINGLAAAASTYSGQNFGAKNYNRLKAGHIFIPAFSGGITLMFGLLVISFRMPILGLFSKDADVLMYASRYCVAILMSQWCFAIFNAIQNYINGVGMIKYSTFVSLLMLWLVRVPSAYLIAKYIDGTYIMFCFPISFAFGMTCMIGFYIFSPKWKALLKLAD